MKSKNKTENNFSIEQLSRSHRELYDKDPKVKEFVDDCLLILDPKSWNFDGDGKERE